MHVREESVGKTRTTHRDTPTYTPQLTESIKIKLERNKHPKFKSYIRVEPNGRTKIFITI